MTLKHLAAIGAAVILLICEPASAYVGPGAGLTLLSALWGLVLAVVVAVGFVVMWPIRRWRRRRQAAVAEMAGEGDDPDVDLEEARRERQEPRE